MKWKHPAKSRLKHLSGTEAQELKVMFVFLLLGNLQLMVSSCFPITSATHKSDRYLPVDHL